MDLLEEAPQLHSKEQATCLSVPNVQTGKRPQPREGELA